MLWQEIREIDARPDRLRSFGLVVGGLLLAIGAYLFWRRGWTPGMGVYGCAGIGGALVVAGLAAPGVLRPAYRVWMGLALVLGFVMTRVILFVVFALSVVPIGLVMRGLGRDPLQRKMDRDSYWIPKAYADPSRERLEKYY